MRCYKCFAAGNPGLCPLSTVFLVFLHRIFMVLCQYFPMTGTDPPWVQLFLRSNLQSVKRKPTGSCTHMFVHTHIYLLLFSCSFSSSEARLCLAPLFRADAIRLFIKCVRLPPDYVLCIHVSFCFPLENPPRPPFPEPNPASSPPFVSFCFSSKYADCLPFSIKTNECVCEAASMFPQGYGVR